MTSKNVTLTEEEYSYVLGAVSVELGKQRDRLDSLLQISKDTAANIDYFKNEVEKGKQLLGKLLQAKDVVSE